MASKITKFINQVEQIVNNKSDEQTEVILSEFDRRLDVLEQTSEDKEAQDAPNEEIEELKAEVIPSQTDEIKEVKQDNKTILAKVQDLYILLQDYISKKEDIKEKEQPIVPPIVQDKEVSTTSTVKETVTSTVDVTFPTTGKASPLLSVLSMLKSGFSLLLAPLTGLLGLFKGFIGDWKSKTTLIILTVITLVAGLISLIKWVWDNIEEAFASLWKGIDSAINKLISWIDQYIGIPIAKAINWIADKLGLEAPFKDYVNSYSNYDEDQITKDIMSTIDHPSNPYKDATQEAGLRIGSSAESLGDTITKETVQAQPDTQEPQDISSNKPSVDTSSVESTEQNAANQNISTTSYNVQNRIYDVHLQDNNDLYVG